MLFRGVFIALCLGASSAFLAGPRSVKTSWVQQPKSSLPIVALEAGEAAVKISAKDVKALRDETDAAMMKCKQALVESDGDIEAAKEWLRAKGLASAAKKSSRAANEGVVASYIHTGSKLGVMVEINCETDFVAKGPKFKELAKAVAMQIAACPSVEFVRDEDISEEAKQAEREAEMKSEDLAGKPDDIKVKMVEGRLGKIMKTRVLMEQPYIREPSQTVDEFVKGYISTLGENIQISRFSRFNLGETQSSDDDEESTEETFTVSTPQPVAEAVPEAEKKPDIKVSAKDVKALRDETDAAMMKCKQALVESNGDMEAAKEWLRSKGLASAAKKAGRAANEGVVASYIHTGSKLGVMVEINCETDFVAKGPKFKELAKAVAMQIAACPSVEFVRDEDISEEAKQAEREAEMKSEDLAGKPDDIKVKMVEGRLGKIMKTRVLMEQPYIRDPSQTVDDLIKGYITTIGENIQISRFSRFNLGETQSSDDEESEESE